MNMTAAMEARTNKPLTACTDQEIYLALLDIVREQSAARVRPVTGRKLYYISAEFLIGKLLSNNLINLGLYDDTRAALQVAADLGAEVEAGTDGTTYTVRGGLRPHAQAIHIGESGLAARLFTPIAALCGERITITGRGSILRRPLAMMEKPLRTLGAKVTSEGGYLPIRIEGPLHGGAVSVDGSLSSQFITGLLMALPLAERDTTLTVHNLKSRPYIDMTLSLLGTFGIDVKHNEYRQFFIEGRQRYAPARYNVEGDWSGASCLLVAGATTGEVTVRNLNPVSLQADMAIVDALTRAGAQITLNTESGKPEELRIKGRHDACIALRAPVVVEAAAAVALCDLTLIARSLRP